MNIGFSTSVVHTTSVAFQGDLSHRLLAAINRNTSYRYTCEKSSDGYYLKPAWREMPSKSGFVPDIKISVTITEENFVLHILGQPAKSTRMFFGFWFVFLLLLQLYLLAICDWGATDFFVIFTPIPFLVFGYLLCKLATLFMFRAVAKAIQKELP